MCINSVAPNTPVGRGFAECRIVILESRSCLSTRRNDSVPVVGSRPVPQNAQVAVPESMALQVRFWGKDSSELRIRPLSGCQAVRPGQWQGHVGGQRMSTDPLRNRTAESSATGG